MRERLRRKYLRLQYLYRERGIRALMSGVARQFLAAFYHYEMQHLFMRRLGAEGRESPLREGENTDTDYLLLESPEALQAVVGDIPMAVRFSVRSLRQKVQEGAIVILARRPSPTGDGRVVVGYGVYQQGVFPFLRRVGKISSDLFFCHYLEVLPEYRGQRLHDFIAKVADAYGRQKGAKKNISTIAPQNQASILSTLRAGSTIIGKVERGSMLMGLFWWETPWKEIEAMLAKEELRSTPPSKEIEEIYKKRERERTDKEKSSAL